MKEANLSNLEFASKVYEVSKKRNFMTLFIDNIRLYERPIQNLKKGDFDYVTNLMANNNLLKLLRSFEEMKFIIFTNLEDTPIDSYIKNLIPENVLAISAVNAEFFGGKVVPAPYGLKRQTSPEDNRNELIKNYMSKSINNPKKLLYVNHTIESNFAERSGINELFTKRKWATVEKRRVKFSKFLDQITEHKFMICPIGNAIDCHRNWEVLYLRRVPVMKKHPYLIELFKDFPVLFVDDFSLISDQLLEENAHLFEIMQKLDLNDITLPSFYQNFVSKFAPT
jgi:hypothetical protein